MATSSDLNAARKNLSNVLGDSMKDYMANLNAWFKRKLTKEEFDHKSRTLMKDETVHLHNEFLLAMIGKCQSLAASIVPKDSSVSSRSQRPTKVKKRPPGGRANLQQRFQSASTVDFVPHITSKALEEGACPTPLGFVSREGLLPDSAMIHGRMLVCAWESGLGDVNDKAVKLLLIALENQLKNILTLVIKQRKGYKLRENRFTFAAGIGMSMPYLKKPRIYEDTSLDSYATSINSNLQHAPSLRPSPGIADDMAVQQDVLGEDTGDEYADPISLWDLRDTLMLHKSAIVSHAVCGPTLERVNTSLWHPSHEELEQDDIHRQQMYLKHKAATMDDSAALAQIST